VKAERLKHEEDKNKLKLSARENLTRLNVDEKNMNQNDICPCLVLSFEKVRRYYPLVRRSVGDAPFT